MAKITDYIEKLRSQVERMNAHPYKETAEYEDVRHFKEPLCAWEELEELQGKDIGSDEAFDAINKNEQVKVVLDEDGDAEVIENTYDVVFNDDTASNAMGWEVSEQYCRDYIERSNGTNDGYFEDYKGGVVSIVCNETGEEVYETEVR